MGLVVKHIHAFVVACTGISLDYLSKHGKIRLLSTS